MKEDKFKLIASVYLITIKDGKILMSRRFQTGFEDGNYSLVAGHLDEHETLRQAMVREASEEAGITFDTNDLNLVLTMHRKGGDERIDFFFIADKWQGEIQNMEPDKCDDLSWFPIDNLPNNTIPYIKKAIECYKNNIHYCEFGW